MSEGSATTRPTSGLQLLASFYRTALELQALDAVGNGEEAGK